MEFWTFKFIARLLNLLNLPLKYHQNIAFLLLASFTNTHQPIFPHKRIGLRIISIQLLERGMFD